MLKHIIKKADDDEPTDQIAFRGAVYALVSLELWRATGFIRDSYPRFGPEGEFPQVALILAVATIGGGLLAIQHLGALLDRATLWWSTRGYRADESGAESELAESDDQGDDAGAAVDASDLGDDDRRRDPLT